MIKDRVHYKFDYLKIALMNLLCCQAKRHHLEASRILFPLPFFAHKQMTERFLIYYLCNLHSAKGRFLLVSRRKQSIDSKELNPLQIKYPSLINCLDILIERDYVDLVEKGDYSKKKKTSITSSEKLDNWFKDNNWTNG